MFDVVCFITFALEPVERQVMSVTRKMLKVPVSLCMTDIHRDFLHRPPSGYLPEEIWRKAGTSLTPEQSDLLPRGLSPSHTLT